MDKGDLIRELRALADKLEERAPGASMGAVASDPLGGLERASVAEEVASLLRHDLRNHLASIRNAAFYLRRRTKDTEIWRSDPRVPQFFTLIDDTVLVSTGLLEDRLSLKHLFSRSVARVAGASCVEQGVAFARVSAAVTINVDAGAGDVAADRAEVALAIRCVIENAVEAARSQVTVAARARGGRYEIAVTDDGSGVPEASVKQIFDAFHTTKEGHAGLGLNIARRVARRYGGEFELLDDVAGRGACMVLTLPLLDAADHDHDHDHDHDRDQAGLRLLLVDDDQSNLLTLSVLLEGEGFVVDVAASFAAAKAQLAAAGARYDLVVLDQNLGDGHGSALLPLVRERMPEAKALLISGDTAGEALSAAGFDAVLIKSTPFPELLAKVLGTIQRAEEAP
jgi:CheY-like chemotaxis protein/anti-sigma regulatory factor (Ser/Thr protein kinase)